MNNRKQYSNTTTCGVTCLGSLVAALAWLLMPTLAQAQEQAEPSLIHPFDLSENEQDGRIEAAEAELMDFYSVLASDSEPGNTGAETGEQFTSSVPEADFAERDKFGQNLPKPLWDNAASSAGNNEQGHYLSEAPAPQYDASQGQWMQLEVGQADSGGLPASAESRSGTVSTLPAVAGKIESAEEDFLKNATGDTIAPITGTTADNSQKPPAVTRDRQHLRDLFGDMMPADNESVRSSMKSGVDPAQASQSAAVPAGSGQSGNTSAGQPSREAGSSAILQAGGLLTADEHFGSAGILPALAEQPATQTDSAVTPKQSQRTAADKLYAPPLPPDTPPVKSKKAATASAPAKAQNTDKQTVKKSSSGSRKPDKAKSTAAKAAPAAVAGQVSLILINETGNERVGEIYSSVLSKMGYSIISVGNNPSGTTPSGRTVINYKSGSKAKAQAVARHLPGRKSMVEAKSGEVLAADIMVFLK